YKVIVIPRRQLKEKTEIPVRITITQALPKGNKLDYMLQKATELGASHFTLFQAERSVVKWDEKRGQKKLARYETIVKEASEQSHRNQIPTITAYASLQEMINENKQASIKIFAYEEE